jgi:hypothetical protein
MTDAEDLGSVSGPGGMVRDAGDKTSVPFDEEIYLRLNADVRQAVASGMFRSGRDRYEHFGRTEGRSFRVPAGVVRDRILIASNPDAGSGTAAVPAAAVDTIKISHSGSILLVGWVNDALDRRDSVDLYFSGWSISFDGKSLARLRRPDAEAAMGYGAEHSYGFWVARGG